jgi:hypothetical protein
VYELKRKSGLETWEKLDMPGVEICVLRRAATTGAQTVLTRIAPGG